MKLYRYEDVMFAGMPVGDGWEEYGASRLEIVLHEDEVTKETPKGYWINNGFYKKWVSKTGKKRYAHPTKEEAWISFQKRKQRQITIYTARLDRANQALAMPRPA